MNRYKFFVEYGFVLHDVSTVPVSKGEGPCCVRRQVAVVASVGVGWRQWSDHESIRRDGRSFSKRCRRDELANRLKSLSGREINLMTYDEFRHFLRMAVLSPKGVDSSMDQCVAVCKTRKRNAIN